jgi:hypothetical protein
MRDTRAPGTVGLPVFDGKVEAAFEGLCERAAKPKLGTPLLA